MFQSVEAVGRVEHPYARRDEYFDIYLCRGLKSELAGCVAEDEGL